MHGTSRSIAPLYFGLQVYWVFVSIIRHAAVKANEQIPDSLVFVPLCLNHLSGEFHVSLAAMTSCKVLEVPLNFWTVCVAKSVGELSDYGSRSRVEMPFGGLQM